MENPLSGAELYGIVTVERVAMKPERRRFLIIVSKALLLCSVAIAAEYVLDPLANSETVEERLPFRIYHIIDPNGAKGFGHSAILIPVPNTDANKKEYDYYSYGPKGLEIKRLDNIEKALSFAKDKGYTMEQHWKVESDDDATAAKDAAVAFKDTKYDVQTHNCWDMVYAALKAAKTSVWRTGYVPNINFNENIKRQTVEGSSKL